MDDRSQRSGHIQACLLRQTHGHDQSEQYDRRRSRGLQVHVFTERYSADMTISPYLFRSSPRIGTVKAAVNYYRALLRYPRDDLPPEISRPVLLIWGCQDAALGEPLADASGRYCSDFQLRKLRNASHWVQQDEPDEVNASMESFLNSKSNVKRTTNE